MNKRAFNWDYKTAHSLGQSHVADQRDAEQLRVLEEATNPRYSPRNASHFERQRERHEFFDRNPHLLTNIHA